MKKLFLFTILIFPFLHQAQVSLVKDINSGAASSMPSYSNNRMEFNGELFFAAYENVTTRMEIWKSDGTTSGTTLLKNIGGNNINGNPRDFLKWSNELLFHVDQSNNSFIYRTDGSIPGTVSLQNGLVYNYKMPIVFNNELYFQGSDQELNKLSSINGTPTLVYDVGGATYPGRSNPEVIYANKLFFTAETYYSEPQIWSTDGTSVGTTLVKTFGYAAATSTISNFKVYNGKLYFTTNGRLYTSDPEYGVELWVTDGTTTGTVMVQDINVGAGDSNPADFTLYNGELYFTATSSSIGRELFKITSTGSIVNVFDINTSGDSSPSDLFVTSNRLYYAADDGVNGREIWVTNTYSGATKQANNNKLLVNTTQLFMDINPTGSSNPSGFANYNGKTYFSANDGINGQELWLTDLTISGTYSVSNINPSGDSNPKDLIVANNLLFFSADDGATGLELYKYQDPSLSVNAVELENSISLYPNPTTNSFSIETKYPINNISVFDIQGKTVKLFKENLAFYDIEELTSGLYFVNIKTENGSITKKIIKE
jgi:ELWxxDGT repeat protein